MRYGHSYVYIVTNYTNAVLYVGVTSDIVKRIWEHKQNTGSKFTTKYKVTKLVYYEVFEEIEEAIKREKQLKAGSRKKKIDLINKLNPKWRDLYEEIIK